MLYNNKACLFIARSYDEEHRSPRTDTLERLEGWCPRILHTSCPADTQRLATKHLAPDERRPGSTHVQISPSNFIMVAQWIELARVAPPRCTCYI
ncbi:hypothetical protein MPSEU_000870200 [Mayamaea pseudoterrestris]|nr:hypothetical protein MPSEU_000870200 [Mayamaea pseudoterrestris]